MADISAPPSHRRILAIALPILLANVTVPLLGAIDTAVVGQMGAAAPIGAVGIGAVILASIYWIFGFIRMGTTGLAAQAIGAGDSAEVAALLSRALLFSGAAGLGLITLQGPGIAAAFALSPASAEVEALARSYLEIRVWGAPAAIANVGITGWLIAQERTRAVLALQLWVNGLNVVFDLWFVLGLGWGVEGVAYATLLAEYGGLGLGLWLCRAAFATPAWRDRARVFEMARLVHMARVNGDIFIRSLLLQVIFVSFLFLAADFGDVTLAANQILLQFLMITAYALDGFAFAVETLVGQAMGARARRALRGAALRSAAWACGVAALLALAFGLGGGHVIALMSTSPEVRAMASAYLPWMVAAPLVGVASYILDGIFIGATRTADMRNMMVLSTLIYAGAVALLMPWLGNHGLWAALLISLASRGATLAARYPALERAALPTPDFSAKNR